MDKEYVLSKACLAATEACAAITHHLVTLIVSRDVFGREFSSVDECLTTMSDRYAELVSKCEAFVESRIGDHKLVDLKDSNAMMDHIAKRMGAVCDFAARSLGRGLK